MWVDFIRFHAQHQASKAALIDDTSGRRLTYADLDHEVSQWATTFDREGLRKGDRVAMLANNCVLHVTQFFACARLGAIFVPLNFRLGKCELEEQLARLDALLFYGRGPCTLEHGSRYRDLDQLVPETAAPVVEAEVADTDPLLMLFTSGSTGIPKGVLLSAGMLLWNTINTQSCWGFVGDDVSVVQMPFFHTGGYNVVLLPLLRLGATLVLVEKFDPARMLELIVQEQISIFFGVPTMFRMMQQEPSFAVSDLSSIRFCISGGAPCPANLIEAFRAKGLPMKQGYGLTEVGPNCFFISDEDGTAHPDSIGRPMMHLQAVLRDDLGKPVAVGEVGELCLKGPVVCAGYWRMDEVFTQVCREGWFHTGDLMRCDEAGLYYVVGRKKDMYISGGENVYPGEVVRQLVKHPLVEDAVVIAVPDARWGEVGFAFLRTTAALSLVDLRLFLTPLLSRYKHPHHLRLLEQFPLLPNNKVDMARLTARALKEIGHR